jgi:PmbA protein
LSIYADKRFSTNTTSDLRPESLEKFVKNAVELTKYLAQDEFRLLPDPKYYARNFDTGPLEIRDPDHEKYTIAKWIDTAKQMESAAHQSDKIISATSSVEAAISRNVLLLSNGFSAAAESTSYSIFTETTVKDGDNGRPEDYAYANARNWRDLPDVNWIAKEAARRALAKIGQQKIASGKYDMIVLNDKGWRILKLLRDPMEAGAIQQGRSFLEGKIGQKIASEKLTMIDDPTIPRGQGSRLFDGEGLAAQKRPMIENGVLRNFYIDTYYGRKLKLEPTSGGGSNIIISSGTKSLAELIKSVKRGILVTDFLGGNSNSTTGDFSIGVLGQLIENGQITRPVSSMNIAGNSNEFWNQLAQTGNDPFTFSSCRTPTMVFENISFSGV